MSVAGFKVEFPRRQATLSIYEDNPPHYPWLDISVIESRLRKVVAHEPVFVWPMPTQDGCFIVEHQDGHCQKVQPYELTFLGSKELFDQYSWEEE